MAGTVFGALSGRRHSKKGTGQPRFAVRPVPLNSAELQNLERIIAETDQPHVPIDLRHAGHVGRCGLAQRFPDGGYAGGHGTGEGGCRIFGRERQPRVVIGGDPQLRLARPDKAGGRDADSLVIKLILVMLGVDGRCDLGLHLGLGRHRVGLGTDLRDGLLGAGLRLLLRLHILMQCVHRGLNLGELFARLCVSSATGGHPRRVAHQIAVVNSLHLLKNMVGETRFELATLCSQSRCATRLRYSPTGASGRCLARYDGGPGRI